LAGKSKDVVAYFPHYINDSRTLFILTEKYGDKGYVFWYRLLELLCKTDGHFYTCKDELDTLKLVKTTCNDSISTHENLIFTNEAIGLLVERGKLDKQLWDKNKVIWCQKLVDNLEPVYRNRRRPTPMKPNLHVEMLKTTTQSRVDKSKVKENKEKYADFVNMTKEEHTTLVKKFGESETKDWIEKLNFWKGSKGKKTKSDYFTILSWERKNGSTSERGKGSNIGTKEDFGDFTGKIDF